MTSCSGSTRPGRSSTASRSAAGRPGHGRRWRDLGGKRARWHRFGGQSGLRDAGRDDPGRERPGRDRVRLRIGLGRQRDRATRCPGSTRPPATSVATIPLDSAPTGIAVGAGAVWVTSQQTGELLRVDPADDRPSQAIAIGQSPDGVAVGAGSVWVADAGGTVSRFDLRTGQVRTIRVGRLPRRRRVCRRRRLGGEQPQRHRGQGRSGNGRDAAHPGRKRADGAGRRRPRRAGRRCSRRWPATAAARCTVVAQ